MQRHTDAFETRVKSVVALASKTGIAEIPRDAAGKLVVTPYAVIWPSDGTDSQGRLTGPMSNRHPSFALWVVGSSYANAQKFMEQVKAKFVNADGTAIQMVVAGEYSYGLRWSSPQPVQTDNDITPPLVWGTAEITWDSDPA